MMYSPFMTQSFELLIKSETVTNLSSKGKIIGRQKKNKNKIRTCQKIKILFRVNKSFHDNIRVVEM